MYENFYKSFEDQFRGSRKLVTERLKQYLPFITPFNDESNQTIKAIDLGCGRGEWLEIMKSLGYTAIGYDIDDGMISECKKRNFTAEKKCLIDALTKTQTNSIHIITSFHVIEHISFEQLKILIHESFRVLKPGGLLILETPNSENITVGTDYFYTDPTHIRPIQKNLLNFLIDETQFYRSKILGLQHANNLDTKNISLLNVISSVSPDYAIVAQKKTNPNILKAFDEAFSKSYGITLNELANHFENRIKKTENMNNESLEKIDQIAINTDQNQRKIISLLNKSQNWCKDLEQKVFLQQKDNANKDFYINNQKIIISKLEEEKVSLQRFLEQSNTRILEQEKRIYELEREVILIHSSNSWKVTAPLRLIKKKLLGPLKKIKITFAKVIFYFLLKISKNPKLKTLFLQIESALPKFFSAKIRNIYATRISQKIDKINVYKNFFECLTPKEKKIYLELKQKMSERN